MPKGTGSTVRPRTWFTRNWSGLRPLYATRLAKYLTGLRVDAGETQRDLAAAAQTDGEKLSQAAINLLERIPRALQQGEDVQHGPYLLAVMWRLYHAGHTLAELEQVMLEGATESLEPSIVSREHEVLAAFRQLSEPRRQELEHFATVLLQLDAKEQGTAGDSAAGAGGAVREQFIRDIAMATTDNQLDQWTQERRERRDREGQQTKRKHTGA